MGKCNKQFKKKIKCGIINIEGDMMSTRMEKYYEGIDNTKAIRRSVRNKEVYNDIYTYGKYTNIEGIADIKNANEVDITKVKEMLKNRENYQKERQYRRLTGEYKEYEEEEPSREPIEEKNYDILDVLKEAKEKKEPDDKQRVLRNTQYNILKNVDLQKELEKAKKNEEEENLQDLINTITNTSMINKITDVDLAADLLSDLKEDDENAAELNTLKEIINKEVEYKEPVYDKSFFTSSLKLNKSDFVDGEEGKKTSPLKVISIVLLIVVIIVAVAILVMKQL